FAAPASPVPGWRECPCKPPQAPPAAPPTEPEAPAQPAAPPLAPLLALLSPPLSPPTQPPRPTALKARAPLPTTPMPPEPKTVQIPACQRTSNFPEARWQNRRRNPAVPPCFREIQTLWRKG